MSMAQPSAADIRRQKAKAYLRGFGDAASFNPQREQQSAQLNEAYSRGFTDGYNARRKHASDYNREIGARFERITTQ
jgi:collagenase-like PrtC family protease